MTGSTGLPVRGVISLVSEVNAYKQTLSAENDRIVTAKLLPFGLYRVEARHAGLAAISHFVEIRSAIPNSLKIVLSPAAITSAMEVRDPGTLIDPYRTCTIRRIGRETIQDRENLLPGRSISDLVVTQPGWLFEANGVLHPRGSEYQVHFVLNGVPLEHIHAAAFTSDFDVDNVQSMSIMTAGYPAEYGRKLGGVIDLTTARDARQGWHGKSVTSGGSFDSEGTYAEVQSGWGANTFTLSADRFHTDRFLNPLVEQNYSNRVTNKDLMAHYDRDFGSINRLGISLRRGESAFLVPNEMVQQQAGQRQDRSNQETAGQVAHTHVFSVN